MHISTISHACVCVCVCVYQVPFGFGLRFHSFAGLGYFGSGFGVYFLWV